MVESLSRKLSALPLFVALVGANHTNDAFAFDDLAILAKLLH
jgi:hypothetical protein